MKRILLPLLILSVFAASMSAQRGNNIDARKLKLALYAISNLYVDSTSETKLVEDAIVGMLENYDFIEDRVLAYFRRRLDQAPRDADFALDYVKRHALTIAEQQGVIDALLFKCNVLWAQLDALYAAYVAPGMVPPGAIRPEDWA